MNDNPAINPNIEWPFPDVPPREVQLEALSKGFGKTGFAYFMRQRLGKTWTAYAEFYLLREKGEVDWCVIICPNTLKEQWQESIEAVDPFTPILIYDSQTRAKTDYWLRKNKKGGVIIINYESVNAFMKAEYWLKFDPPRTYLVADESTKIKEPTKKMSKSSLELAAICGYTRVLTGKPRANSNADLWAQLKFIGATERVFHQHKYTFSVIGGYRGKQVIKDINTELLRKEMEPHSYIAPDKYIAGFEKVYEPMRKVQLKGEQREMYDKMEDDLLIELGGGSKITAPIALVKYLRLQQISSGVAGDIDGIQHNIVDPRNNPRIELVKEILEDEVENKCIIVCRFKLSIDNLYNELTRVGYNCVVMKGGMGDKLEESKKKFNEDDTCTVLIAQLQVLNFGHNLAGPDHSPCDSIIFYENDFSIINRAQCESRPEKFGRVGALSVYDIFASKMDKYILKSLIKKEDGSSALMNYARKHGIFGERDKSEDKDDKELNL